MAQKREIEETELKPPESLPLFTPPIVSPPQPSSSSKISAAVSDELAFRSDPMTASGAVDFRSSSGISAGSLDLPLLRRPSGGDSRMKRRVVNRCSGCRRKVGLMGFRCRCGDMFCSEHRYSDRHDCSFDYKAAGREAIARENPVVRAAKILKV